MRRFSEKVGFLNHDLAGNGLPTVDPARVIDTLKISRDLYGNRSADALTNHNLKSCAMRERSPTYSSKGHHRADHDVKVTAEVFASMMEKVLNI